MIHDAEADLEIAKIDLEKARNQLAALRLQLRDKQVEGAGYSLFLYIFIRKITFLIPL